MNDKLRNLAGCVSALLTHPTKKVLFIGRTKSGCAYDKVIAEWGKIDPDTPPVKTGPVKKEETDWRRNTHQK